jgi:ElaB/YqjD/DUF883 family membrane-anchored ribosome-binding protein
LCDGDHIKLSKGHEMDDQVMGVAQQGFGRAQDVVSDLAGDAKAQAKSRFEDATGAARQTLDQLTDSVRSQVETRLGQARGRVHDQLGALEAHVIEKPLPALAVAGAIGVFLGLLLRGRGKTVYLRERH